MKNWDSRISRPNLMMSSAQRHPEIVLFGEVSKFEEFLE